MINRRFSQLRQGIALLLIVLMLPLPALAGPSAPPAGNISALIPAATRNKKRAGAKDSLRWNDLLETDKSGRLRAGLLDGSILSLGRESHLRVVQHDTANQRTALELEYGRLRSQVAAITRAGGRFEVRTPHAIAGVIGTDFYVFVTADLTLIICYSGTVVVTPTGGAVTDSGSTQPMTLAEGQMVEIRRGMAATPAIVTADMRDSSMAETELAEAAALPVAHRSWLARHKHILIGVGAAAAAGVVAGVTAGGGHASSPCTNCGHVD